MSFKKAQDEPINIFIYDLQGRMVFRNTVLDVDARTIALDLKALGKGLNYLISLTSLLLKSSSNNYYLSDKYATLAY